MSDKKQATITVNGERWSREVESIVALLEELGHDPARSGIAVALNDAVVPRREWATRRITFGDRVEIVAAVQGG